MARLRQPFPGGILVDQGQADQFLAEQLYPGFSKPPALRQVSR